MNIKNTEKSMFVRRLFKPQYRNHKTRKPANLIHVPKSDFTITEKTPYMKW